MANVFYDFYVGTDIVCPYIGVGAGIARVQLDGVREPQNRRVEIVLR